ncbi:MAG: MFS transporter [Ignavibacteriales bacterium]|nr:MFS transporter [Ignavibacteriales bacterium]MCB9210832.1 MFS transporter [Ignavibacteriales bacterium]MCB9217872.1 MFS transporter [Ignavibacteriales bacterium]
MNENGKLSFKEKFSYGFGDLASVLYWQTFMLYLTYFYTDVFLIPAAAVATMFLVSRLWDGVNDPLMGIIADRTQTKWGHFRPYLLWLSVPFAIMGVLTFTVPNFSTEGKLIWAYITFFGIMMLYTGINIPYTALLGVITPNSAERTSVSSFKFLFAFAAGIIVSATLLPMVQILGDGDDPQGWQYSFMVYGVLAVIFFLITFRGTKERVQPPKSQKSSIKQDFYELFTNVPWLILLLTTIMFILFVALRSSVTVHYFKYFVGTQEISLPFFEKSSYDFNAITSAFNTIGQASSFIGVLMVSWFANLVGKKKAFIILFVFAIIGTAGFYFCNPEDLGLIFSLQIIGSLSGGPLSVIIWAMYADTVDYNEWKRGRRTTGLIFSASTMSQKFGWAIGAFVALNLMAQVGFEPNQAQSEESLKGLVLLFSLIPAAFGVLAVVVSTFYPLNDKKVNDIENELKIRRQQDEEK